MAEVDEVNDAPPLALNVVNAFVPVKVLFNPRIEAPEVP
jgi:hypothetical protein